MVSWLMVDGYITIVDGSPTSKLSTNKPATKKPMLVVALLAVLLLAAVVQPASERGMGLLPRNRDKQREGQRQYEFGQFSDAYRLDRDLVGVRR